jgi:hypothetical protein
MKKSLLIKLHIYAGIFTSLYLIVFGFSTIILNHDIDIRNETITNNWKDQIFIDATLTNRKLAENIRDQMGFMGWVPPWKYQRDATSFKFEIVRIGRKYELNADLHKNSVEILEFSGGFLDVFNGLHFFNGNIPNAPFFIRTWQVYQWLSLFIMSLSLILGIWLWLKYSYKPWQGVVFSSLFVGTIIIMISI